jgi:hypothetical protein
MGHTRDYDQFKLIQNNRETNRGHVENLKRAFEERGNLTAIQPILVNENFEIIDGQHRFIASKELDLPVYYSMQTGLGIADARQMNILHKTWNTDDYAHSYADGGDASYKRYLELRDIYGVSHSLILFYASGSEIKGALAGFRDGEFVLTPEQMADTMRRLDMLSEIAELVPQALQKEFAIALLKCMAVEGYDHDRMVQKLRGATEMPRYASSLDYQRALEEAYNRGVRVEQRTRLF